jgi:predicted transcriptional regulator
MPTVVLEVRSLADTLADAARAMHTGRGDEEARIGFVSPELLWQVLTAKRWELLKAMCGAGPWPSARPRGVWIAM